MKKQNHLRQGDDDQDIPDVLTDNKKAEKAVKEAKRNRFC